MRKTIVAATLAGTLSLTGVALLIVGALVLGVLAGRHARRSGGTFGQSLWVGCRSAFTVIFDLLP